MTTIPTLDRTTPPTSHPLRMMSLPKAEQIMLSPTVPVWTVKSGVQPVVGINILLNTAGHTNSIPGIGSYAAKMLLEGTTTKSSARFAEAVASLGAFLDIDYSSDGLGVSIHCLEKMAEPVLALVAEMLYAPAFGHTDFERLKAQTVQQLSVQEQKNSHLASTTFRHILFKGHPYGTSLTSEKASQCTREDARIWYYENMRTASMSIYVAGANPEVVLPALNQYLGQWEGISNRLVTLSEQPLLTATPHYVPGANKLQTSIRQGTRSINQKHPDYPAYRMANEIFGGYFGSRLMANIREDKGYTYGISSQLVHFRQASMFVIGTDVKAEATQSTLDEIRFEMQRMRTEPVPTDELETVKNYKLGGYLGSINTPFDVLDKVKALNLAGLDTSYLDTFYAQLLALTPEQVMQAAYDHWQPEHLLTVVAGLDQPV